MSDEKKRRITVKYKSANPLFEKWLKEWRKEAAEKNSKLESTFNRAIHYLRKCPIKFDTGQECKILKGFGNKLCKMLDDKLANYNLQLEKQEDNEQVNENISKKCKSAVISSDETTQSSLAEHSKHKKKCERSFSSTSSSVSVGSSDQATQSTLPKRNYRKTLKTISSSSSSVSADSEDFYILEPGNFDIILYIDTGETLGNTFKKSQDEFLSELQKISGPNNFEIKKLNVGDYIWICRDKSCGKELVLPYIFERKRLDDFAKSIKDGRYKEQKFRLKRSGIENIYYLIENYHTHGLPITTLQQATFNTAIQDGFKIKMTNNLKHTARLLNQFSNIFTATFQAKTLLKCSKDNLPPVDLNNDLISLMSFTEFNKSSLKNKPMKVTDLFIKMLIQLHGISVDRALAIVEQFPTPILLKNKYDECENETAGEKLLADIKCGTRKLGLPISKTLYHLFNSKSY